ncbi:hypothetical protein [Streptomyces sp. NPDC047869]|uniref:hypothetical protein n=1 Tax=Streptomyces sp. NPDC047869 TaxID=3154709 RepID=UPI0034515FCC
MTSPHAVLAALSDALIGALSAADPLPIARDGRKHVMADPSMTRRQAIDWLFEGRADPPESRFRPDPLEGLADDPQRRFLFDITADEFAVARPEFRDRYLLDGPGWSLRDLLPAWLPDSTREEIVRLEGAGAFRRAALPNLRTFPGVEPWGDIVVWAGVDEFRRPTLEFFNYFPAALEFYEQLPGVGARDARLLRYVYTSWNNDMGYFVEDRKMRPQDARDEIRRIWGEVFKGILEGAKEILLAGAGISAANKIAATVNETVTAALESFRQRRQLFSLWARQKTLTELVLFRGTTFRRILGDLAQDATHDLGRGTYFSQQKRIAQVFSQHYPTPDDPAVLVRVKATVEDLGEVLDLVNGQQSQEWSTFVAPVLKVQPRLVNEQYNNALTNFLERLGKTMNDYDTIIAPDYLNGGVQVCIKKESIVRKLLLLGDEVPL